MKKKKRDFKFWPELEKWGRNSVFIYLLQDLAPRTQFRNFRLLQIDLKV